MLTGDTVELMVQDLKSEAEGASELKAKLMEDIKNKNLGLEIDGAALMLEALPQGASVEAYEANSVLEPSEWVHNTEELLNAASRHLNRGATERSQSLRKEQAEAVDGAAAACSDALYRMQAEWKEKIKTCTAQIKELKTQISQVVHHVALTGRLSCRRVGSGSSC